MNTEHIKDKDIQKYAFDISECAPDIVQHIQTCDICKNKVDGYLLILDTIAKLPEPVFDFDIEKLVLEEVIIPPKKISIYSYYINFLLVVGVVMILLFLYFFGKEFGEVFQNSSAISTYFIVSVFAVISTIIGIDMFLSFYKKVNKLNYY